MAINPLIKALIARSEKEREAFSLPVQELSKKFPGTFASDVVETPQGSLDLAQLTSRDDSLTSAMFGDVDLAKLKPKSGEGAESLRHMLVRLEQALVEIPALDLTAEPHNKFQRWRLRLSRALDPNFDNRQQARQTQIKLGLMGEVADRMIRGVQELRQQTDDPAMEEFRRQYMAKVGAFLGGEFAETMEPPEERYRRFLQDSGQQDNPELRRAFMSNAHGFKPDPKEDQVVRLSRLASIARDVGGPNAAKIIGAAVDLRENEIEYVDNVSKTAEAERQEKAKPDLLDPSKAASNMSILANRLMAGSEQDVPAGVDGNGNPRFRQLPTLRLVDAYRAAAEMLIGAGAPSEAINGALSQFVGSLPGGEEFGRMQPETVEDMIERFVKQGAAD